MSQLTLVSIEFKSKLAVAALAQELVFDVGGLRSVETVTTKDELADTVKLEIVITLQNVQTYEQLKEPQVIGVETRVVLCELADSDQYCGSVI